MRQDQRADNAWRLSSDLIVTHCESLCVSFVFYVSLWWMIGL